MMMKNKLKMILRYCFILAAIVLVSLLVWANIEPKSYTQKYVASSDYITFDLSESTNAAVFSDAQKHIRELKGVTACSINSASKLAGIMYFSDQVSPLTLQQALGTELGGITIKEKVFEEVSGGCPVHGVRDFFLKLKEAFCFRS